MIWSAAGDAVEKMNSVRTALAQGENEMMVILITSNFSIDVEFNSDEYLRLARVAHNFYTCERRGKQKTASFENLLDYMSRHCGMDSTIGCMLRRCPYAAEIMMRSWSMPDCT